jgi:hypothetical protein
MQSLLLTSVLSLSLTAAAFGQIGCFVPDNLDGPCCAQIGVNLPPLPAFTLPGTSIAWDACALAGQVCSSISLQAPAPTPVCGQFSANLRVQDCAGATLLQGQAVLDYARTWVEQGNVATPQGPAPVDFQVYRFLLKVDLLPQAGVPVVPSVTVPSDLLLNNSAFYYGYVDYARVCQTGSFQQSIVLFHASDFLINFPGISSGVAGANPIRSHALVAPDTAANPFVPAAFAVVNGVVNEDSVRTIGNPNMPGAPASCRTEEDLFAGGSYIPIAFGCMSPPMLGPVQTAVIQMTGNSNCGSAFQSLNLFGITPWIETVSTSIGNWTTGVNYPGPERVRADEGLFSYRDGCLAGGPGAGNGQSLEIFYGAETLGGFPSQLVEPGGVIIPVNRFVDLASNWRRPAGTPLMLPAIGKVMNSFHIISTNPL